MEELKTNQVKNPVVKPLDSTQNGVSMKSKSLIIFLIVILLGIGSGYGVYALNTKDKALVGGSDIEVVKTATEEGVKDAATFRDTAEGKLIKNDGSLTDEGTHILDRGDDSQNVYLISTVVDLNKYTGKKVQVWGETYKGQKAGWLMDVGRIKVL